jgi:hypothetical protein
MLNVLNAPNSTIMTTSEITETPTEEIRPSFNVECFSDDPFQQKPFCEKLENYLMVDHDFVEGGLVVSLNASFGSGKSTFLKMWENDLIERKKAEGTTPYVINLNAWDSDYCGEPLLAIISSILEAIERTYGSEPTDAKFSALKEASKDVANFMLGVGNSIVKGVTTIDPIAAGKFATDQKEARNADPEALSPDLLETYQKRRHALWRLRNSLSEYFGGNRPSAFIFVDELDRCRPDYAVSYLETIKHVFDIHGLVFVLAVDYDHLENSAKSLYGAKLDFDEYFRKFANRSFELPAPTEAACGEFARHLYTRYIENGQNRYSNLNKQESAKYILSLLTGLKMRPRQAIEFCRILGHISGSLTADRITLNKGYSAGIILMCALKTLSSELYVELGTNGAPHIQVVKLFNVSMIPSKAYWWFLTYLGGFAQVKDAHQYLAQVKLLPKGKTEDQVKQEMMDGDQYPRIYKMIEQQSM